MDVSVRTVGGVTILDLSGKVLAGPESDGLRQALDRLAARAGARVLVNLTRVPWMNSAGLGILLAGFRRTRERGGIVRFFGAGERIRRILGTTKLLTVLDVLDDERAGIRAFGAGESRAGGAAG